MQQHLALEAEVGAQLFVRTPRSMVLTHAGETLLRDAKGRMPRAANNSSGVVAESCCPGAFTHEAESAWKRA